MKKTAKITRSNSLGILAGNRSSFLDHLIPLCDLLGAAFYSNERFLSEIADLYYPEIFVENRPDFENYHLFIYVEPSRIPHGGFHFFGDFLIPQKTRSICGFHGNSDKYRNLFWIERFADEDIII
jgi:hypothetical protein